MTGKPVMPLNPKLIAYSDAAIGLSLFSICILRFQSFLKICLPQSSDLCWLIRTGDWILLHKKLPATDILSWWQPDRLVISYQWIFEIVVSALNRLTGIWSIGLLANVVGAVFLFWMLPRNWIVRGIPFSITFAMLSLVGSTYWQFPRPQLFVWIYTALLIHLLERIRTSGTQTIYLLSLVPLVLLWANTHLSFALAIFTIAIYFVIGAFRVKDSSTKMKFAVAFLACALSTLLTPKGPLFIWHAFSFVNGAQYLRIHEVLPAHLNPDLYPFLAYAALASILIVCFWKDLPLEKRVVSLFFLILGLCVNRFEPLSVICSWSCVGDALLLGFAKFLKKDNAVTNTITKVLEQNSVRKIWQGSSALLISILIGTVLWYAHCRTEESAQAQLLDYADTALLSLPRERGKTRVFNDPICGNWMIYTRLGKPFMSNQFDSYSLQTVSKIVQVLNGNNYTEFMNEQSIDCILIQNYCPLYKALLQSRNWTLLRDDHNMSYWERTEQSRLLVR